MSKKQKFHGSYLENDVQFLLKIIEIKPTLIQEKEKLIQSGKKHYSEMISKESLPSKQYFDLFYQAFEQNKVKMAKHLLELASELNKKTENICLVSLARAGTPIGVLLKRTLEKKFNRKVNHYSISIIRDRGIDENALKYIVNNEIDKDKSIIFIDGWTGKGVISRELENSIDQFNQKNKTNISNKLYVLADISGTAYLSATDEDYLIPSSILNSTVSGLISRSILNDEYINKNDFHGCIFYKEFLDSDISLWFIESLMKEIINLQKNEKSKVNQTKKELKSISKSFIKKTMAKYNIKNINYLKPGIGETTRVLLRRVPDKVLIRDKSNSDVTHLLQLCKEKKVEIVEVKDMPYKAVGLISNLAR